MPFVGLRTIHIHKWHYAYWRLNGECDMPIMSTHFDLNQLQQRTLEHSQLNDKQSRLRWPTRSQNHLRIEIIVCIVPQYQNSISPEFVQYLPQRSSKIPIRECLI